MKKSRMAVASIVLVAGITVASAGAANAMGDLGCTTPSVGGTWCRGTSSQSVWSDYVHNSRIHKASTDGASGLQSSGWVGYGAQAHSDQAAKLFGNKSYYNVY